MLDGNEFSEVKAALLPRAPDILPELLPDGRLEGGEYAAINPRQPGGHSLKVNLRTGEWADFARDDARGGDLVSLFAYLRGVSQHAALKALKQRLGLNGAGPNRGERRRQERASRKRGPIIKTYDFCDLVDGKPVLLFQECRHDPKAFSLRRPDGRGGWIPSIKDLPHSVLYNYPAIPQSAAPRANGLPAKGVMVAEGPKDADSLIALGFIATTNAMGAGKWRAEYNEALRGRRVVIFADNDEAGRLHALTIARNLFGIAAEVKIVELPNLPAKGDVSDFIESRRSQGRTDAEIRAEILALIEAAPVFTPEEASAAASAGANDGSNDRGGQSTALVKLALGCCQFFHDGDDPYAIVGIGGHEENHALASRAFRRWLAREYYKQFGKSPSAESLAAARNTLEGYALFEGPEQVVSLRVAHCGGVFLDLCDERRRIVGVTAGGRSIIEAKTAPVRFRRSRGMEPLPEPQRGGNINDLRPFVNVRDEQDFILIVAWLVAALRATGPFPILVLHGEQGSAKTTVSRVLRALIDPFSGLLRAMPRDLRDLAIAATNSHVLALDNLSRVQSEFSDALCRLSTGGSFATRTLYEDREEEIFAAVRPIIVNAIEELATRGDFLDRSIVLDLPSIPEECRKDEKTFFAEFEAARPLILGCLLDGVARALRDIDHVKIGRRPRMIDFALWASAAMPAFGWTADDFLDAYMSNRADANTVTLDASAIAPFVVALASPAAWEGTASDLLARINSDATEEAKRRRGWPANARSLSNALRRIAPNLRAIGVEITFDREGKTRTRTIKIYKTPPNTQDAEIDRLAAADEQTKEVLC